MAYKFFESENSQTGTLALRSGSKYFYGNFLRNKELFDFDSALLAGTIFQAYWQGVLPANSNTYFHHFVPEGKGRLLKNISYKQNIIGGPVNFELILGGVIGSVAETFFGYNGDRRRITGSEWTSTSVLYRLNSFDPTGSTIIDKWFGQSTDQGQNHSSVALEELGIGGIYSCNSRPTFSCENLSSSPVTCSLSWVWSDLDDQQVTCPAEGV